MLSYVKKVKSEELSDHNHSSCCDVREKENVIFRKIWIESGEEWHAVSR